MPCECKGYRTESLCPVCQEKQPIRFDVSEIIADILSGEIDHLDALKDAITNLARESIFDDSQFDECWHSIFEHVEDKLPPYAIFPEA